MTITKEVIEKIQDMSKVTFKEIDGKTFASKPLWQVEWSEEKEQRYEIDMLKVHSLTSLMDYIKNNIDVLEVEDYMLHVVSHVRVDLVSKLDDRNSRQLPLIAAIDYEQDRFLNNFHGLENFIISLQTGFVKDEQMDAVLKKVGNYQTEHDVKLQDDGVTQVITAKTGVAQVGEIDIVNPVILKRLCTFAEVPQPERPYILRVDKHHQAGLFTTLDKGWKLNVVNDIKKYLSEKTKMSVI